jgi:RecB family exonuclease
MPTYSHSRLSSFVQCPLKFAWRYVWNAQSGAEGIEAFVGKRVHESLEWLYRRAAHPGDPPSVEELQQDYATRWDLSYSDRVRIVADRGVAEYRAVGADCLSGYHARHHPFDAGSTVGIERGFDFALDEGGALRIRGVIDRVDIAQDGAVEIHDYKTSSRTPSQAALTQDAQVGIYELAAREIFPGHRQVRMIWHYLRSGVERQLPPRGPAALAQFRQELGRQIRAVESRIEGYRGGLSEDESAALAGATAEPLSHVPEEARRSSREFPPRPSPLCRWCDYLDWCREGSESLRRPFDPPPPPASRAAGPSLQGSLF